LLEAGSFDAIADLAEMYPLTVFPDALGMPRKDRDKLLPFASQSFNSLGPKNALWETAIAGAEPVRAWALEQIQRQNLAPDGLGAQKFAAADAGKITHEEAPLLVRSLLSAGVDTTINGLGLAIHCLARFPEEWQKLRKDPALSKAAFEETIRFESPVQTFFRTTAQATTLAGTAIAEGEKVVMLLGSANRDPRKWEAPDRFDITRRVSGHVGFGTGVHMCVGQLLAKLEAEILLAALARRVASIEIIGTPVRLYNNTLRGLAKLPVRIRAGEGLAD
jgi:cytochrome P450